MDGSDPLAAYRDRFVIDDPDAIYLDGNSLGRLPVATREWVGLMMDQWAHSSFLEADELESLIEAAGDLDRRRWQPDKEELATRHPRPCLRGRG